MGARSSNNPHRHIQLRTLRIIVAIAQHGSFVRAAEALHLVPSAISRRIKELEALLGVQLLRRTPHSINFTEAGEALLARARRILAEVDGVAEDLVALEGGLRGRVRLAASVFSLFESLPADLATFQRHYPLIDIAFQTLSSKQVIAALYQKQIDIGIFAATRSPEGLDTLLYHEDRLTVLMAQDHPLVAHDAVTLAELAPFPIIGAPAGTETERLLTTQAKRQGLVLDISMTVGSLDAMVLLTQAGLGSCIVPSRVWERLGPFPEIRQVALNEKWARRQLRVGVPETLSAGSGVYRLYRYLARHTLPKEELKLTQT